jgi:hypothetical protein|nr:MAG TPA: hypothetical protein [Caudoviricetes sp.]
MGYYDINFRRLALLLLPIAWRKPKLAAFAQSCVQGVVSLHKEFSAWQAAQDRRLHHNGQVCHLRGLLNDTFDCKLRRIRIIDGLYDEERGMRLFRREHERGLLLPQPTRPALIINRRGFGGARGYDFWIQLPLALRGIINEATLTALVDNYKLASKRWMLSYN